MTAATRANIAIHNWLAAYKAANGKEHLRPVYSNGWIIIAGSGTAKVRISKMEEMTETLQKRIQEQST